MRKIFTVTPQLVLSLAETAASKIPLTIDGRLPRVYAIPRGGVSAALAIARYRHFDFVGSPADADVLVDDLIDSGATMAHMLGAARAEKGRWKNGEPLCVVLVDKKDRGTPDYLRDSWLVFPWEGDAVGSFEDNIRRLLEFIGEDVNRGGLADTPQRVTKAWQFWAKGYKEDPAAILKTFEDGAEGCDEMVMVRDIPFYTHCEHHLAPFFGTATVAYIPDGKIVGLSKINRVLDCFARRLQVQERLTAQVADALWEHLSPKGVGVIVKARHLCMESRGVCQQGHHTVTSALRGVMTEGTVRQEFLALAHS